MLFTGQNFYNYNTYCRRIFRKVNKIISTLQLTVLHTYILRYHFGFHNEKRECKQTILFDHSYGHEIILYLMNFLLDTKHIARYDK